MAITQWHGGFRNEIMPAGFTHTYYNYVKADLPKIYDNNTGNTSDVPYVNNNDDSLIVTYSFFFDNTPNTDGYMFSPIITFHNQKYAGIQRAANKVSLPTIPGFVPGYVSVSYMIASNTYRYAQNLQSSFRTNVIKTHIQLYPIHIDEIIAAIHTLERFIGRSETMFNISGNEVCRETYSLAVPSEMVRILFDDINTAIYNINVIIGSNQESDLFNNLNTTFLNHEMIYNIRVAINNIETFLGI